MISKSVSLHFPPGFGHVTHGAELQGAAVEMVCCEASWNEDAGAMEKYPKFVMGKRFSKIQKQFFRELRKGLPL